MVTDDELEATQSVTKTVQQHRFQQAALVLLAGGTAAQVASVTGWSKGYTSTVIKENKEFQRLLKEMSDRELSRELSKLRSKLVDLLPDVYAALVYQLREKKDLNAVRIMLEQVGGYKKDTATEERMDPIIQVVLPGASVEQKPADVVIKPEVK